MAFLFNLLDSAESVFGPVTCRLVWAAIVGLALYRVLA